jgi:squalene-hopene/tetraprenyl-beta-curcumene cyclase
MTYAGLLSYSYAEVGPDDPRVQAALDWIRKHYTVDENPGMGAKALYYYYLVFAKALAALDQDVVVDGAGVRHDWRRDLGGKLLGLQHPEGYWVNEEPAWWQDNEVLVTAFTVQALNHLLRD